ncbi:MAG: CHAD domain-containing protein [Gammaproteobacteria bacterium]
MPTGSLTDPFQRADVTIKQILYDLLGVMEQNEEGILQDSDPEYLHDFRVAIRRTRSLLGQIEGVLPERRITRFGRDFSWLGNITGPCRDMDVYLISFDAYQSSLPASKRGDLGPLQEYLYRHKEREHKRLTKALATKRYQKLKHDWRDFLKRPPVRVSKLPHAGRPVIHVASERIWRVYRKAIKQGRDIGPGSPAIKLHELRKTCKKLRYLNEFFQFLYPEREIRALIESLKTLQDNLGEFQDLQVQQGSLRTFALEMERETGISSETRHAMEILVFRLEQRKQRVRVNFAQRFNRFASTANHGLYRKIHACRQLQQNAG